MSASPKLPFSLTREEFLAWCPDDGQRWQLMDGEPMAMAPARFGHAALQSEVSALLRNHLMDRRSPCVVLTAPGVVPHVRAGMNFRVPDLGVTCAPVPADATFVPAPLLLVEILSPGNERDSWANVWAYTTIPSVREILVLHTKEARAELLRRQPDGNWPANTLEVTEGELVLDSLGFAAPLAALYRTAGISGTGSASPP
jgi:Uma2 family endonuclease